MFSPSLSLSVSVKHRRTLRLEPRLAWLQYSNTFKMPQWDYPYDPPYSIYQCERPSDQAPGLISCRLREPLKSPDHIRLLKIYPPGWPNRLTEELTREDDSRIQCDVFQVSLASMTTPHRPYFATLSYAWGDPGITRKIHCAKGLSRSR